MKNKTIYKTVLILIICFITSIYEAIIVYGLKKAGINTSINKASENLNEILIMNILQMLPLVICFIICYFILKQKFWTEMYLRIDGKNQRIIVAGLIVIFIARIIYHMIITTDKVTGIYNIFYYVLFVALSEEFISRDVCTYIVKDEKTIIRYIIPNSMFALMHIFSYSGWGKLSASYLNWFLTSQFLGLLVGGCCYQLMKEKSGTIWVPVLVHAIFDC